MPPEIDEQGVLLRGAPSIARFLKQPVPLTYYGLERGYYDAFKLGGKWVSTPRRLRNQFAGRPSESTAAAVR